jgi:hypothetical protein
VAGITSPWRSLCLPDRRTGEQANRRRNLSEPAVNCSSAHLFKIITRRVAAYDVKRTKRHTQPASSHPAPIHFGTSGWRDIIAQGFTFAGVTAVTRAAARRLKALKLAGRGVLVGHDPRFLAEQFTAHAARVLSGEGISVHVVEESAPTPALSAAIIDLKLAGGINFTASHNPAEYQGFKWSNAHGSPATREEVAPLEKLANTFLAQDGGRPPRGVKPGKITPFDPKPGYFQRLEKMLPLELLRGARLSVVADPLYGAGRGYLDEALRRAGCRVSVLHDWRDPLFGGQPPEPSTERLQEARERMRSEQASLVLSTDGDADRFGVLDADGSYLTPNEILALTVYLLVKHRGGRGRVVRSVVTSHWWTTWPSGSDWRSRSRPWVSSTSARACSGAGSSRAGESGGLTVGAMCGKGRRAGVHCSWPNWSPANAAACGQFWRSCSGRWAGSSPGASTCTSQTRKPAPPSRKNWSITVPGSSPAAA